MCTVLTGGGVSRAKEPIIITKSVRYVGHERPENVPNLVTRAYTAKEVEENYVLKLEKNNIGGINVNKEVNPETYIKKNILTSNIYYQSSGKDNNLKVDQFHINEGQIYQATDILNNNESLTLKLLNSNKTYINSVDSDEGLYILDNTDPFLSVLKPTNHIQQETHEVKGEGKDTSFIMSDEEVLTLDNKISLFQEEKLTNAFDRYGNANWWSIFWMFYRNHDLLNCDIHLETFNSALRVANSFLPHGVNLTGREIEYILENMGKYKLRIWVGSALPEDKNSYGVLMRADDTEWDGVRGAYLTKDENLSPAEFPPNAETKREDYSWEIVGNSGYKTIRLRWDVSYRPYLAANKNSALLFDGKEENVCKTFAGKKGSTLGYIAVRGVQVYKDPSFK